MVHPQTKYSTDLYGLICKYTLSIIMGIRCKGKVEEECVGCNLILFSKAYLCVYLSMWVIATYYIDKSRIGGVNWET